MPAVVGSQPFWRIQDRVAVFLRVGQCQGQGVCRIRCGLLLQVQHPLHHLGDGQFLRRAIAHDGLLHFPRGNLTNIQPGFGCRTQAHSPRFPHDQGGLEILGKKQAFHHREAWLVLADDIPQGRGDQHETAAAGPGCRTTYGSVVQGHAILPGLADHTISCPSQGRVDTQDDLWDPFGLGRA